MRRTKLKIKLGVDLVMIIAFLVNMFTGFAIFFGLVLGGGRQYSGVGGFNISNIAELSTKAWYRFVHDWSGILMVILILIHLILNWNTLWCYLKNSFKKIRNEKIQSRYENI
jgi:cytochrome b subunit of formate dehydrogenase